MDWPVTSEPSRAKVRPLRPRRSCFGPLSNSPVASGPWFSLGFGPNELMVEPPGTAPGSDRFITTPVYRHSRPLRDGTPNIGGEGLRRKGALLHLRWCRARGNRETESRPGIGLGSTPGALPASGRDGA